jgi:hypothetical protein
MILDWQLQHSPVSAGQARQFIARHHAHCGIPTTWRFHGAVYNGRTMVGVAIVGNLVARPLSGRGILEINPLCNGFDSNDPRWQPQRFGSRSTSSPAAASGAIIGASSSSYPCQRSNPRELIGWRTCMALAVRTRRRLS